jgi:hypothetical protein
MEQRGRKSAAGLAVVTKDEALAVPSGLTAGERAVWLRTVCGRPSNYFGSEHVAMLVEYCRLVCRMDVIDQELREFQPEWMATDEGLKRYDRLIGMGVKLAGATFNLARAMRLTHHAVNEAKKAIPKPGGQLWQREKQPRSA